MTVQVNGERRTCPEGITVQRLIETLELKGPLAVEVNAQLVRRAEHAQYTLREGDRVEIVTLVGGGA